ncbi:MAG: cytochrome b [Burkholderiales bacterium]|nr:cytochrome b [Burkholderiales bacterium]
MEKTRAAGHYTGMAIVLHWIIAIGVIAMFAIAYYMTDIPKGTPERAYWFNLHKSIGTTIGVLVLVRLAWRASHTPPSFPASVPAWEATLARINHFLLYACLVVMPVIGFLASNFTKYGVKYFGISIGPFFAEDLAMRDSLQTVHGLLSYLLGVLVLLHVAAALKHLLVDRDGVFQRMLPGGGEAGR